MFSLRAFLCFWLFFFCQFQPSVAYKSVAYNKSVYNIYYISTFQYRVCKCVNFARTSKCKNTLQYFRVTCDIWCCCKSSKYGIIILFQDIISQYSTRDAALNFIKDFFRECKHVRTSQKMLHLLNTSLMENSIFGEASTVRTFNSLRRNVFRVLSDING